MKYAHIRQQAAHFPVMTPCRLLEVQRSACYDWQLLHDRRTVVAPEAHLRKFLRR